MGGGFPNTELRSITEVPVLILFDFIALDVVEFLLLNVLHTLGPTYFFN